MSTETVPVWAVGLFILMIIIVFALQGLGQPRQPAFVAGYGGINVKVGHHLPGVFVGQHQFAGLAAGQRTPIVRHRSAIAAGLKQAAEKSHDSSNGRNTAQQKCG